MTPSLTPTMSRSMPTLGRKKEGAGRRQQHDPGTLAMVTDSDWGDGGVSVMDGGCDEIDEEALYMDEDFEMDDAPLLLQRRLASMRRGSPPPDDDVEDSLTEDMGRDETVVEPSEPGFSFVVATPRGVTHVEPEQPEHLQRRVSGELEDEIGEEEGLARIGSTRREQQPVTATPDPPHAEHAPAHGKEAPPQQAHRQQGQEGEAATRPAAALPPAGRGRGKGAAPPKGGGAPERKGGAGRGRESRLEVGGGAPQEGAGEGVGRGRGRGRGGEDLGATRGKGAKVDKAGRKNWRPREEVAPNPETRTQQLEPNPRDMEPGTGRKPRTRMPNPEARNLEPGTWNPDSGAWNPEPETGNPKPKTQKLQP